MARGRRQSPCAWRRGFRRIGRAHIPVPSTAFMIFSRVSLAIDEPSRNARDTVMVETPARCATSDIVGTEGLTAASSPFRLSKRSTFSIAPVIANIASHFKWGRRLCSSASRWNRIEILDTRFERCIMGHARVEQLWTGARWSEGPAWFAAGRYLAWLDIPNNGILRFDECNGAVAVFRQPSNNANGNTVDREGGLVTCEHLTRRVTRTKHDGSIKVLSDSCGGKRRNLPNDVVVKSDGSVWFSDPSYGISFRL